MRGGWIRRCDLQDSVQSFVHADAHGGRTLRSSPWYSMRICFDGKREYLESGRTNSPCSTDRMLSGGLDIALYGLFRRIWIFSFSARNSTLVCAEGTSSIAFLRHLLPLTIRTDLATPIQVLYVSLPDLSATCGLFSTSSSSVLPTPGFHGIRKFLRHS